MFFSAVPASSQDQLPLTLPATGDGVAMHVAGRFTFASINDGDAAVDVVGSASGQVIGTTPLTVRVRKDATTLTAAERNGFLSALAQFNDRGLGRFNDFRNVHTQAGSPEAHFRAGFLPWHRSFLLDLERELQDIDPTVALPYWRFDRPARSLFSRDFGRLAAMSSGCGEAPSAMKVTDVPDTPPINRRRPRNARMRAELEESAADGNKSVVTKSKRGNALPCPQTARGAGAHHARAWPPRRPPTW